MKDFRCRFEMTEEQMAKFDEEFSRLVEEQPMKPVRVTLYPSIDQPKPRKRT